MPSKQNCLVGEIRTVRGESESLSSSVLVPEGSKPTVVGAVSRLEWLLILGVCCVGVLVRFWRPDLEAVEHFDEGVYASVLWYDAVAGQPWPSREFFAPAGLPFLIELAALLPGVGAFGPFLPAMIFGSLTPLAVWWTARQWYGQPAGLFALCVSAGSDFHILYSRTALTDVPATFFLVLAVGLGTLAIYRGSLRLSVLSGLACGCGWWLKYTGWLPIAVLVSGSTAWWIVAGRRTHAFSRLVLIHGLMIGTTCIVFSPYWWSLQSSGGYSAVASHHGAYLSSFAGWSANLAGQLAYQFRMDGYFGALALGLGCLLAGWTRCAAASRSTWNAGALQHVTGAVRHGHDAAMARLRGRVLVITFSIAVVALRVRTPLVLCCLTAGGMAGLYLWPLRPASWVPARVGGRPSDERGNRGVSGQSASIDPALAFWVTLAWLTGMLLATPLYTPYSRLFFPFMTAIWLGAAGAVSWWLDANVRVAGQMAEGMAGLSPLERMAGRVSSGLLALALLASFLVINPAGGLEFVSRSELFSSRLFQDRSSIRAVAGRIAATCGASADGVEITPPGLVTGQVFTASSLADDKPSGPELPLVSADVLRERPLVVYGYGEPALLMHLDQAGLTAMPVAHVPQERTNPRAAEFLVIGPNAWRTPGFAEEWSLLEHRYQWLGDFAYRPGEISLMDLYSAKYLSSHEDATVQRFELYRLPAP